MITLKTAKPQECILFYKKENLKMNENSECLCAKEKEQVLGYSLFQINNGEMLIRAIEPQNDLMLLDGVLRSTLHIAASRNVKTAKWGDKAPEKVFKLLGFINSEGTLNIGKLYESKCCGCKKE